MAVLRHVLRHQMLGHRHEEEITRPRFLGEAL
jgi:hypothetical protein